MKEGQPMSDSERAMFEDVHNLTIRKEDQIARDAYIKANDLVRNEEPISKEVAQEVAAELNSDLEWVYGHVPEVYEQQKLNMIESHGKFTLVPGKVVDIDPRKKNGGNKIFGKD